MVHVGDRDDRQDAEGGQEPEGEEELATKVGNAERADGCLDHSVASVSTTGSVIEPPAASIFCRAPAVTGTFTTFKALSISPLPRILIGLVSSFTSRAALRLAASIVAPASNTASFSTLTIW